IDRKERVAAVARDTVALDETLGFNPLVFGLVPYASEAFGGRAVVRQLEHAAQQYRHVIEFGAGAALDVRNDQMRQIGIRAAEIEMKFHGSPNAYLRSEEHTSELQSRRDLVCRLLLERKNYYRRGARPVARRAIYRRMRPSRRGRLHRHLPDAS